MKPASTRFCILALLALALLPYVNSLGNGYTVDDSFTYANNAFIRDWRHLPELFTANYFTYSNEASYRPVCTLSYFVDWALFGLNPVGPHAVNVLLFAATVLTLFFFFRGLTGSAPAAGAGAALFALHPLHSEAVNSLSFREDLQVGLLLPLAWLAYRRGWLAAAWAAYALATLAKESAIIYPALVAVLEIARTRTPQAVPLEGERPASRPRPRPWLHLAGLVAVTVLFLLLRFHWMRFPLEGHQERLGGSWGGTLIADVKIQAAYLALWLFPAQLNAYYPASAFTPQLDRQFWVSLAALLALAAALWRWRRQPWFVAGTLWWFGALAPVANFYPIYNPMAERYLYLPSVGACLWLGSAVARGLAGPRRRPVALLALAAAVALGVRTWHRNPVWHDNLTLWRATAAIQPDHPVILSNLAAAHYEAGDYDRVVEFAERALDVASNAPAGFQPAGAYLPLGCAHFARGDTERALHHFRLAAQLLPLRFDLDAAILRNLGLAHDVRGDLPAAADAYARALTIDPFRPQIWGKLAYAQLRLGRQDAARASWSRARALDTRLPDFDTLAAAVAAEAGGAAP